jgi:hypothetical protein
MKIFGPKKASSGRRAKAKEGARILSVGAIGPSYVVAPATFAGEARGGSVSVDLRWDEGDERALRLELTADEADSLARRLWARSPVARGAEARGSNLDGSRTPHELGAALARALHVVDHRPGEAEALAHLRARIFELVEEHLDAHLEGEIDEDEARGLHGFENPDQEGGETLEEILEKARGLKFAPYGTPGIGKSTFTKG